MGCADAAVQHYVLITPARNEDAFIEGAIDSIVAQRQRPLKWVIVSDGSTDRTDEIVTRYTARYDFIQLLRRHAPEGRSVSSKVAAFRHGYAEVAHLTFHFVGNFDADIIVDPEYFACVLERFARQPRLGICGAIYWNRIGSEIQRSRVRAGDTSGGVQLFRRECYEEIGGYRSLERGGEDTVAAAMARMKGWTTRSFPDPVVIHRRPFGAHDETILRYRFRQGAINHGWGAHPLFVIAKAARRLAEKPRVLGSAALLGGYFSAWLRGAPPQVPDDVIDFIRREQMDRLLNSVRVLRPRAQHSSGAVATLPDRSTPPAPRGNWSKQRLFGIGVDALRLGEVLDIAEDAIRQRRRLLISSINADKVVKMSRDSVLRTDVLRGDMILADGMGIVWAARILGKPLPERVAGVDVMLGLLQRAHARRYRVYLFGASETVLAAARRHIAEQYPDAAIVGSHHGYYAPSAEAEIADQIATCQPDLLFVGNASPVKERFLAHFVDRMQVPVCLGVGGAFDVLGGKVRRAPLVWQRLGLEWAFRLAQEPRRLWRRYLSANVAFPWMIVSEYIDGRRQRSS